MATWTSPGMVISPLTSFSSSKQTGSLSWSLGFSGLTSPQVIPSLSTNTAVMKWSGGIVLNLGTTTGSTVSVPKIYQYWN